MTVFVALATLAALRPQAEPLLWLRPDGRITVEGKVVEPTFSPGTRRIRIREGTAFDFDGKRSGILLPDSPVFRLRDEITVSCWIYLRTYWNDGPGTQIFFRGDDRCGLDPYTLVVHADGTAHFGVQDADQNCGSVSTEVPLFRWVHLMGTFSRERGRVDFYRDGVHVAFTTTSKAPFLDLDPAWAPGIGIGNVQNEKGPHNQPLNGSLFDLRLYRQVLTPDQVAPFPGIADPPR
jgi:hypothetical protein